ncbi:MAG: HD domain-containing protein, partial [Bacteroidota bacterium]
NHIFDVYEASGRIAAGEGVTGMALALLRIAALFHDAGFIHTYDHHEARGADMAAAVMPVFGFDADQIRTVCGMILATRVPQRPATHLERILCDADLDYLGRDDFYTIGRKLYEELRSAGAVDGEDAWNQLQVKFLGSHGYHTSFSRHHREPAKQERLKEIRSLIEP